MKTTSVVKDGRYRSAKNSIPDYDFLFEDNLKEKSKKGNALKRIVTTAVTMITEIIKIV